MMCGLYLKESVCSQGVRKIRVGARVGWGILSQTACTRRNYASVLPYTEVPGRGASGPRGAQVHLSKSHIPKLSSRHTIARVVQPSIDSQSAPTGNYSISITANGAGVSHATTVALNIEDATIALSKTTDTVSVGNSTSVNVSLTSV